MILRLDLTTDLLPRLTQIAQANHRDLKEQVLYYLEWAVSVPKAKALGLVTPGEPGLLNQDG